MNNFISTGYEADVGLRCDVFLTNGWEDVSPPVDNRYHEVWFSRRIGSPLLPARRAFDFSRGKFCAEVPARLLSEYQEQFGAMPSTGLCGLSMLISRAPATINVFGFGHFKSTDLHYFDTVGVDHVTHSSSAEADFFSRCLEIARHQGRAVHVWK